MPAACTADQTCIEALLLDEELAAAQAELEMMEGSRDGP